MKPAIVFYTCVTGAYDAWRGLDRPAADAGHVYFSDGLPPGAKDGWEIRPIPDFARQRSGGDTNRFIKMHPHLLFPAHSASVYVDGNVSPTSAASAYCQQVASEHVLSMYRHPVRDCLFEEARECERLGLVYVGKIARRLARYRSEGFPAHAGLTENNVLIRRHHDPQLVRLMTLWWREYGSGVTRDQISLPYLLWREKFPWNCLGESDARLHNRYFAFSASHQGTPARRIFKTQQKNAFYRRIDPQNTALALLMQYKRVTRWMMKVERKMARHLPS